MYRINVYNGRGDCVERHGADNAFDAVSEAYKNIQGVYGWAAHIILNDSHRGIYIARWDDFSARGLESLEAAAEMLRNWEWR